MVLNRNKLFILRADFDDPAYPGQKFYCWHCILMEGLLASFSNMAREIDVERIPWPRPRNELVSILGPDNQSLPVLILANGPPEGIATKIHNNIAFVDDMDTIFQALSLIYDIPIPHP